MKKGTPYQYLVCNHEWEKQELVGEDFYRGHIVDVYCCKCKKCGEQRNLRFWKSEVAGNE